MKEGGGAFLNLFYTVNSSYLLLVEYVHKIRQPDEISMAS